MAPTEHRGRTPSPTPKWNLEKHRWEARVTLPTDERAPGGRKRDVRRIVPILGVHREDEERAKRVAKLMAIRVSRGGAVPGDRPETLGEWAERWIDYRENELKLESVRNDRAAVKNYLTELVPKAMAKITRADLEDFRDALDRRVQKGELNWKTATNTWGLVAKMFKDAARSKRRDLRVLEHNPATEVEGPDRGADKAKQFLWPSVFLAFVGDELVPLAWRRMLAVSLYLYVRPEEMAALEWADVHLEEGVVLVHRAMSLGADRPRLKKTKTGKPRRVPIEPSLRPLLEAMKREADGKGRLVEFPPQSQLARVFRDHLEGALGRAKIEAADLFVRDETRMRIDWRRATRDTGITWRAVRGDSAAKIMHAAGHKDVKTTMGYVIEADGLAEGFGSVFPPIPASLCPKRIVDPSGEKPATNEAERPENVVGAAGFEPATSTV